VYKKAPMKLRIFAYLLVTLCAHNLYGSPIYEDLPVMIDIDLHECTLCNKKIISKDNNYETRSLALPCNHKFHRSCILKNLEKNKNCPTCKKTVPDFKNQFFTALENNQIDRVKKLLQYILDIDKARDRSGNHALYIAADRGFLDMVLLFLNYQDDPALPNTRTKNGETALHQAAFRGHNDILKLLIKYEAPVNIQTPGGATALWFAVAMNHRDCVETLLKADADKTIANHYGETPLERALNKNYDEITALLLE